MCVNCLRQNVDITEGINRSMIIHSCRSCGRFLCPPWQNVALESKELLAACMRKIPGLSKLRVVDAVWIWTEPHSMRLKIKITVQKEVFGGAILQQAAVVDFNIKNQQCKNCEASYAQGVWHAVVQVRQRVPHKRTFFLLEQILLKHHAHSDCINIVTFKDGMDFYFKEKGPAVRFIDFLEGHVPLRQKHSRKLVSSDIKACTGNFKDNYLIELVPICKDDLISMPKELARNLSDMNPLCLVKTVQGGIHLVDPQTGEKQEMSSEKYWRHEFKALTTSRDLVKFIVLAVEPIMAEQRTSAKQRGAGRRMQMAHVTIAKEAELGVVDRYYTTKTQLGHLLKAGDAVMGYDLTREAWASETKAANLCRGEMPDIVLVRKDYTSKLRNRGKSRKWELKQLEVDETGDFNERNKRDDRAVEQDYETFLQEIEADRDMRGNVNIYKAGSSAAAKLKIEQRRRQELAAAARSAAAANDDVAGLKQGGGGGGMEDGDGSDWETDEDEEVDEDDDEALRLDELLDDLYIAEELEAAEGRTVLTHEEAGLVPGFDYLSETAAGGGFSAAEIDPNDFDFSAGPTATKGQAKGKAKGKGKSKK